MQSQIFRALFGFAVAFSALVLATGCDSGGTAAAPFNAAIAALPETGNAPLRVQFSAAHNGGFEDVTYAWDFGDGGTATEREPDYVFETAGSFTVRLTVTDPARGEAKAELALVIAPSVDFSVTGIHAEPRRAEPGENIQVTGGLANGGGVPLGAWQLRYVLSADESLSEDDLELDAFPRTGDIAQPLEGLDETFTLPADLPTGSYFVGVAADAEEALGDAHRADNVGFSDFPIEVRSALDTGPDLVLCGVTVPGFATLESGHTPTVQQGDQLEVSLCVANAGDSPTLDGSVELFLSQDSAWDADDLSLYQRTGLTLGAGDRFTEDGIYIDVPLDLPPGRWFLLAVADRAEQVEEQSEDNNTQTNRDAFEVVAPGQVDGVDLVVSRFEVTGEPAKVLWGQAVPVALTVVNRGQAGVQRNFVVRVEAEPSDGTQSVTLTSINVNGLAAGGEAVLDQGVTVTRRVTPGTYCLRALADPTGSSGDANPANNGRRASCLTLGGEPSIDFAVRSVAFEPRSVVAGASITVQADVQNLGEDASGAVDVAVVLSGDATLGGADVVVDTFALEGVEPGATVPVERSVEVPVALDRNVPEWHVAVVADPGDLVTGEVTEENNAAFAAGTLLVSGAQGGCAEDAEHEDNDAPQRAFDLPLGAYPELGLCDPADWFAVELPAGAALVATLTVSEVSFAANGTVPDLEVRTAAGQTLGHGEAFGRTVTAILEPAAVDRSLLLGITADAHVVYALDVAAVPAGEAPNLRPRGLQAGPPVVAPEGFFTVGAEAVNLGGADAGPTAAGLYLVAPGAAPAAADRLGRLDVGAVMAGAVVPFEGAVQVPAGRAAGAYELVLRLDDAEAVDESTEADNEQRVAVRVEAEAACPGDRFEPNRSPLMGDGGPSRAAELPAGVYPDLVACDTDDDWYAIDLAPGEGLLVSATFAHAEGDLDLTLFGPDAETDVAASSTLGDTESIEFFGTPEGGQYFLRVQVFPSPEGGRVSTYDLDVAINPAGGCVQDEFDPNPTSEAAAVVADGDYVLTLCPGNEDWFRFSLVEGNTVTFRVQSDAALHLYLYGPDGEALDDDDLAVVWDAAEDGIYRLRIDSDSAVPVSYSLRVRGASGIDLEATDLQVAPESARAGEEILASATVRNGLGDTVADVGVRFLLSDDEQASPGDTELGRVVAARVGALEPASVRARLRLPVGVGLGARFVLVEVDPDRQHADARRQNNTAATPLTVRGACVDDDPRANEGPATATPVDFAAGAVEGGVVCAHTEDWYLLEAPAGDLRLDLAFEPALGDLDLYVYAEDGETLLAFSATEDVEQVVVTGPGIFLVRVDGFLDAESPYDLTWTTP